MARHWSDRDLDRITPPQVLDERGRGLLRSLDQIIGDQPIADFYVKAADTCPAEALPALIAEYSMEEFVDPSWPEIVQRRVLKNAWLLQTLEGRDIGVKLGLSLLGLNAVIEQWWQISPKGPPNTHTVYFDIDEQVFADTRQSFEQRELRAAKRMIEATKRWSQDSKIVLVVKAAGVGHVRQQAGGLKLNRSIVSPAARTRMASVSVTTRKHAKASLVSKMNFTPAPRSRNALATGHRRVISIATRVSRAVYQLQSGSS